MRWTSEDEPSVAIVMTWVSPRVNRPEPWARGRTPTSTEIWRSSVRPRPSIRMPSSRASWRAVFLWIRLNRLLLTRASRRAASWSALLSPPVRVARNESAMPVLRAAMRAGRSLPNQISRLAVASASGRARCAWASSMPKKFDSVGSL